MCIYIYIYIIQDLHKLAALRLLQTWTIRREAYAQAMLKLAQAVAVVASLSGTAVGLYSILELLTS